MNPDAPLSSASRLLRDWASRGLHHFSTEEMADELGVSLTAARSALRRLEEKGSVASPYRGFHVVVPPEHQRVGCLPADQFVPQLMERLDIPYYAGLLTAARYRGGAHQQPQVFQVVVPKNRPPIKRGLAHVAFVARHNAEAIPTATARWSQSSRKTVCPRRSPFAVALRATPRR